MADLQFLKTAPPRVFVDVEALYDLDKAVLDLHEREFGERTPPTWIGSEYPLTRNVSTKYGKRMMTYYKQVPHPHFDCVSSSKFACENLKFYVAPFLTSLCVSRL